VAKEKRSLFSRLFGTEKSNKIVNAIRLKFLNGYIPVFTKYDGKVYDDPDARICIDTIARNGAKLNPKHVQNKDKKYRNADDRLQKIISERPNDYMNGYYFYYYILSELYTYNEAFVYIQKDKNFKPVALYPLHYGNYEPYEYQNKIYLKFNFGSGQSRFIEMNDLIHLKRFTSLDSFRGGDNKAITKVLSMKHILDEGIINAIKVTQSIKGVIKESNSMLKPDDAKKIRQEFIDSITSEDSDGFGVLDATKEFKPITLDPKTATAEQMKMINDKVLAYFGLSESIIQSKYSESEWNAFYESVIEPCAIQMSHEFTNKLFTETERNHGNKVIFTSNRLQYASNETKINVLRYANNLMMVDELREIFNMEPLPNGEGQKVLQDLNHIDSNIAKQYQVGNDDKDKEEGEQDE